MKFAALILLGIVVEILAGACIGDYLMRKDYAAKREKYEDSQTDVN